MTAIPPACRFESYPGSLSIPSPLAFAEGLLFFLKYFQKKEGFLKPILYIINVCEISH